MIFGKYKNNAYEYTLAFKNTILTVVKKSFNGRMYEVLNIKPDPL